jgi:hypothetical protein
MRGRRQRIPCPLANTGQGPDFWHLCLYLCVVHASEHSLELELFGAPKVVAAVPHRRRLEPRADHRVRDLQPCCRPRGPATTDLGHPNLASVACSG